MASSFTAKAQRRAAEEYAPAIRDALRAGESKNALDEACGYLKGELKKRRERDPNGGALLDAEFAGLLMGYAATVHTRRPLRPAGGAKVPSPDDLLAVCDDALTRALEGGGTDG